MLVSVVIPTFNRLEYLKLALGSALRQTYKEFEIVVTDDSTTDQIQDYILELNDKRIKFYRNEKPLGIALNTKNGISKSSGEFVAFLNDDDFWDEHFLEKMMQEALLNDNLTCIFSDHYLVNKSGNVLRVESENNSIKYKRSFLEGGVLAQNIINDLFINFTVPVAMACMFRRDVINLADYPNAIGGAYDRWILLQCCKKKNAKFCFVKEKLTYYRVHSGSVSATRGIEVVKSVLFILMQVNACLKLNFRQKVSFNAGIRGYLRWLFKREGYLNFTYWKIYFRTFLLRY